MLKKFMYMVSLCLIVLSGCGTTEDPTIEEENGNGHSGIVAGEVESMLEETGDLTYVYTVKNQTEDEIPLSFTSSQRYDFELTNETGEVVYLHSSVTSYLQQLGEETIAQGEMLEYPIDITQVGLESGDYTLKAWMTPTDGPMYDSTIDISVE
ncbi:BsuPI-related putative proteinase inhibitor [Bacillus coahuilensis]|uniref:BsuPI-related putative proteinase inhibitor n=1 Tax=Bacillus coahuilensis TaxID=408580 RepID=UPI0001851052|nr:BsuPI-related putative proteinase inhibitor [Bacillus coahuilensis]